MTSRALVLQLRNRLGRSPQAALPVARGVRPGQEHLFPPAAHLLNAEDHRARCALLVRLPDAMVITHGIQLDRACLEAGFQVGAQFLAVRQAALLARRDADGALPEPIAEQVRFWTEFTASQGRTL